MEYYDFISLMKSERKQVELILQRSAKRVSNEVFISQT